MNNHQAVHHNLHRNNFTPVEYSTQLIDVIFKQNTIICSSKHTSILFIIHKTIERFRIFYKNFKVVILSNNASNLNALKDNLKNLTNLNIIQLKNSNQCFIPFDILLVEITTLHYLLKNDLFKSSINYLIIDNCDLIFQNSCLNDIVDCVYLKYPNVRILAITSEIQLNGKISYEIEHYFKLLSTKLHSKVNTLSDFVWSIRYRNQSNDYIIDYENQKNENQLLRKIETTIDQYLNNITGFKNDSKCSNFCNKAVYLIESFKNILNDLGLAFIQDAINLFIEITDEYKNKSKTDDKYMLLSSTLTLFETIRLIINISNIEHIKINYNPKIKKLEEILNYLSKQNNDSGSFLGLIFVGNSMVAKLMNDYLQCELMKKKFENLSIDYHISKKLEKYVPECIKNQGEEIIKKVKLQEVNVLITTNPLKSRYDLPKFHFIINFDNRLNYSNFTYLKEKAAFYNSNFIWISDNNHVTYNTLIEFYKIDEVLLNFSFFDDIDKELYEFSFNDKKVIKANNMFDFNNPFVILNNYCHKLPGDSFTKLTSQVLFQKYSIDNHIKYICSLRLPINSPIKCIIKTDQNENCFLAKWNTAYKACKVLRTNSELDEGFSPISKDNYKNLINHCSLKCQNHDIFSNDGKFLLSKKRHIYKKKIANSFHNAMPDVGISYLYAIEMKMIDPVPDEFNTRNRKIFHPEHFNHSFGILTKNKLSNLCSFPVYIRSGEIRVFISDGLKIKILSKSKLDQLKYFHNFLFTNVLNFSQDIMVFNSEINVNNYLIVPIFKEYIYNCYKIDWEFVEKIYNYRPMTDFLSNEERKLLNLKREDYLNAVVSPWYRPNNEQQFFYVSEICDSRNPLTAFQSQNYSSYYEYFKMKYNIEIQNTKQFLLDVDVTSLRLNFLTPRYINRKGVILPLINEETKERKDRENFRQFLIPELCRIHPFPASLWKKAVSLPCILYRINSLLLADEIRTQIYTLIGVRNEEYLKKDWAPLDFGWNLKERLEKRERKIANKILEEMKKELEIEKTMNYNNYDRIEYDNNSIQTIKLEQTNTWNFVNNLSDFSKNWKSNNLKIQQNIICVKNNEEINFEEIESENDFKSFILSNHVNVSNGDIDIDGIDLNEYFSNVVYKYNDDDNFKRNIINALKSAPSPSEILEALTMSNANDGFNLERLETIGDSELKLRVTDFLYASFPNIHEGYLSHLRSKQVSNFNLFHLGSKLNIADFMISTKFDPPENWLPPCFIFTKEIQDILETIQILKKQKESIGETLEFKSAEFQEFYKTLPDSPIKNKLNFFVPFNVFNEQCIPEKSIADCIEALIGIYLIKCGHQSALYFMTSIGLDVLHRKADYYSSYLIDLYYSSLPIPQSPINKNIHNSEELLDMLLQGYDVFENHIGYKFKDRSYLLQAFSHASFTVNTLTDCYQKLEFLGDAVLDFLITCNLYNDSRKHSPGILTDLRSALVNNIIFALIAVRNDFHKYFRHLSHDLYKVINDFVAVQKSNIHNITDDYYYCIGEDGKEVEAPKALGDIFESIAGAIYLDSNRNLNIVWSVFKKLMAPELKKFNTNIPKSPVRELLELEPETTKFFIQKHLKLFEKEMISVFSKRAPVKLSDAKGVEIKVEIFGKGIYSGIGRSYRIAKSVAAKEALKALKTNFL